MQTEPQKKRKQRRRREGALSSSILLALSATEGPRVVRSPLCLRRMPRRRRSLRAEWKEKPTKGAARPVTKE